MKKVNIRVQEYIVNQLEAASFKTISATCERAVEAYPFLRMSALKSLKRIFTVEEMRGLVAAQNGLLLNRKFQISKQLFLTRCQDAEEHECSFSLHKADPDKVFEKIEQLNEFQVFFLQEEIDRFWNALGGKDLKGFVSSFL